MTNLQQISNVTIYLRHSVDKINNGDKIVKLNKKGGENMDKDQIKSFVAGLGIASLVAGVSIAAPSHAAKSG